MSSNLITFDLNGILDIWYEYFFEFVLFNFNCLHNNFETKCGGEERRLRKGGNEKLERFLQRSILAKNMML